MKKIGFILIVVIIVFLSTSCDNNPCDEGYTQIDNGLCIPDYVLGIEKNNEFGNIFYHSKYGVIKYENGNWYNNENLPIKNVTK